MTANTAPRSRRGFAREFYLNVLSSEIRGRRECRALDAPAASCVIKNKHTSVVTTVTPVSPGIPRAMVLRLTSRSPRCPGLFDTVACASYRRLDASIGASEPHDLAVRFSIIRPARYCSPDAAASTASRSAFVTCARPSVGRTARISELIWVEREAKYFCKGGLTRFRKIRSDLPVGQFR